MRSLLKAAGATVAASALLLGAGVGPAGAQAACPTTATNTSSTHSTDYHLTTTVMTPKPSPGGTVTVLAEVTGAGALVNEMRMFFDKRLTPTMAQSASTKVSGLAPSWVNETNNMEVFDQENDKYLRVESAGWTTANATAALEVTFRLPADAAIGDKYEFGGGYSLVLAWGNYFDHRNQGVCATVERPSNPINPGTTGSLTGSIETESAVAHSTEMANLGTALGSSN